MDKLISIIIKTLMLICIVIAIFCGYQKAYGAAHLTVNMHPVEEEELIINDLFPETIISKFEIEEEGKLVYVNRVGTFIGIKLIRQIGTERIELTSLIITDTTINLESYNLEKNIAYQLCIKPYYDFEDLGILNVSAMSEYNFSNYIIKSSKILPPKTITFIF